LECVEKERSIRDGIVFVVFIVQDYNVVYRFCFSAVHLLRHNLYAGHQVSLQLKASCFSF